MRCQIRFCWSCPGHIGVDTLGNVWVFLFVAEDASWPVFQSSSFPDYKLVHIIRRASNGNDVVVLVGAGRNEGSMPMVVAGCSNYSSTRITAVRLIFFISIASYMKHLKVVASITPFLTTMIVVLSSAIAIPPLPLSRTLLKGIPEHICH